MPAAETPVDIEKTAPLLLRATVFCWLLAKLIGWRMFTVYRVLPTAPVFDTLNKLAPPVHTFLYILSVLLLLLLMIFPQNKVFLFCMLITEVFSCLLDQNRIQPWNYQYAFILFIFIANKPNSEISIKAFSFILISVYIYGGLGKLNTAFLHTIWSRMVLQQFLHIAPTNALQRGALLWGYAAGLFEIIAGAGLFFRWTRKISAYALIGMHVFILIFLGPLGIRYNIVVWPWNMAMIIFLYAVFIRKNDFGFSLMPILQRANLLVLICWGILPAFNFVGWWDNYLSSGIYSGKLPGMVIYIKDTSKCTPLKRYCITDKRSAAGDESFVNLQYWSMAETKMAPYPEIRSYKKIADKLAKLYPDAGLSFVYLDEGKW